MYPVPPHSDMYVLEYGKRMRNEQIRGKSASLFYATSGRDMALVFANMRVIAGITVEFHGQVDEVFGCVQTPKTFSHGLGTESNAPSKSSEKLRPPTQGLALRPWCSSYMDARPCRESCLAFRRWECTLKSASSTDARYLPLIVSAIGIGRPQPQWSLE